VDLEAKYDKIIFDPLLRDYFGTGGYYNVGYWDEETRGQAEACKNLIDKTLEKGNDFDGSILEVGCGLGASTQRLTNFFPAKNITAINISRRQLIASKHRLPEIDFLQMDASKMMFDDSSFDKIISIESVFHIDSRKSFLDESYRVLRQGGELLFTDILFKEDFTFHQLLVPAPNRGLNLKDYPVALKNAGFEKTDIVDITNRSWTPFCQNFLNWFKKYADDHHIEINQTQNTLDEIVEMRDRVVSNYLIVHARKI